MISEAAIWAIFLLPLGSFAAIVLIIRPFLNRFPLLSGLTLIGCLSGAFGLSVWALWSVLQGYSPEFQPYEWLEVMGGATIEMGLLVDEVTAIMLIVVTSVSLLVQVYSLGYMDRDPGYCRYFAFMSLFTAAMLGLVLSVNIIQLYVFWELVGLSSYLLIGFWHERPAAAAAAKKAFIVTRIGDTGFLIAILYLFLQGEEFAAAGLNAFHIPDIWQAAQPLATGGAILAGGALTWVTLGIFAGAAGKSGQFPLHTWLPDAMEGPTPVSALIHAATMVAAGVFLVARFYPLFQGSSDALTVVALVGASTALIAATMGLVMNDIKRVMAYSTISQLGYMMAGLGIGVYAAALFHLATHAAFKALLFLGAGSVNHATGTFDMRYMGGLRRYMPFTYALTVIGGLSLVGIIPLAGFWSKDEILAGAWSGGGLVDGWVSRVTFGMLLAAVVLTAFYTFRMLHLTFHGQFRGGADQELEDKAAATGSGGRAQDTPTRSSHEGGAHLAESPRVMVLPMVVLGVGAVAAGYLANPQWGQAIGIPGHWISEFLGSGLGVIVPHLAHALEPHDFSGWVALFSTLAALAGLTAAAGVYARRGAAGKRDPLELAGPAHTLLSRKYFFDALYEDVVVRRGFYRVFAGTLDWLDRNVIDGFVDTLGWTFRNIGSAVGRLQTGQVQAYGAAIALGGLLIILGFLLS